MAKINTYIIFISVLSAVLSAASPCASAGESKKSRERKIKAAFVYNFINFIDWPEESMPENDDPVKIAVIGTKNLQRAFKPLVKKKVKDKSIQIKHFVDFCDENKNSKKEKSNWDRKIKELKKNHIVFIGNCKLISKKTHEELIEELKFNPILTISEKTGFLENGGIINYIKENKKVSFEINLKSADRNHIRIRSRLLKLARRVIKDKQNSSAQKN